ncbi:hypothetical protein KJ644_02370 [Candidatus Dependentiae bacterium]|nr:hypothetical protein [Candidatus Dependentiae bacterium]MBU4387298.1 hypothetical protein [Candidatus Dependentiae bacterium]MCG2756444.1 hypothetical protein [Candidatus Dependentiae bacterium]
MYNFVKNISKNIINKIFNFGIAGSCLVKDLELNSKNNLVSQIEQRHLLFFYKNLLFNKKFLPKINEVGFRSFSQTDEDGILLYIFAVIGTDSKICVDIAFANPFGANTTNLICNWGWTGLLVCGSQKDKIFSDDYFKKHPDTFLHVPKIINKWVTAENINDIIKEAGITGTIDLLSLDIDGVDYWVWEKLEIVNPRVIVVEFNYVLDFERSITIPYKDNFVRKDFEDDYYGASIQAFIKLADIKGYRLVAFNKYYFNAFFVKKDLGLDLLPTLYINNYNNYYSNSPWIYEDLKKRYEKVKNLPWVEID